MDSKLDNTEAYGIVRWILDNADTGFFIITAPHRQQRQIAEIHTSPRVACYDYSSHGERYSYHALSEWADTNQDTDILFILNMQVALQEDKNLADFNLSRDMLARKDKTWVFFMTKDTEYRLSTFAHDIYSYVRMKAHFQAEEENEPKELQILDFHDRQSVQKIKAMLEQYKELEERLMLLSLQDTSDSRLLSAANTLADIAKLYSDCAEYDDSFRLYKKELQIREKTLGKEHPNTATTYNNIALVYAHQGDYPKALEWSQKALAIREKVLGKEHPDTATTYNNIALVYYNQGDYPKALEWYQKALAIREKALGKEHPNTATTYNNIAGVYDSQGDYPKALEWYQKAIAIREKVLGKEHPDTATTYNNIAAVYARQGDYPKALEWYIKSYRILLKLGEEHPNTSTAKKNMKAAHQKASLNEPFEQWLQKKLDA